MLSTQYANWLKIEGDNIFFWHHPPKENIKDTAVIIIGPIGPEYMPCHRSIRLLADKISQSGLHCIRYDPIGMGNSSGSLEDKHLWGKWSNTPKFIANYFREHLNVTKTILIGVRSGCLVLSDVEKNMDIEAMIFWHPQTHGRKFLRGIQLLDSVLYQNNVNTISGMLEGGGYPFTQDLQESIKEADLATKNFSDIPKALIINTNASENESKLSKRLKKFNTIVESVDIVGLDDMIKQVTLSKIPHLNIDYIISWLETLKISTNNQAVKNSISINNYTHSKFNETVVTIDSENSLFGILTTPTLSTGTKNQIVLFPNTGAAHHAGPNRIHVDVARILAENEVATLRFDLSNLGESSQNYEIDPPQEFPSTAAIDINTVINYVQNKLNYKNITLCGISAGAHNVYHAVLESESRYIDSLILINPDTFYWNPEQTKKPIQNVTSEIDQAYYQQQIFNYKKWLTLLRNPKKLFNISIFILHFMLKKFKTLIIALLRIANIKIQSLLEKDISKIGNRKIKITLIYSKGDPAYNILMSQASATLKQLKKDNLFSSIQINYADHTFSSIQARKELYDALVKTISNI